AANAFLASLNDEQRAQATFRFEDEERFFFHFIPAEDVAKRYGRPRKGVGFMTLNAPQRHLAHALISSGLSQQGAIKVSSIMSLDDILRIQEGDTTGRRNSDKYFISIFGTPSESGTWGYRIEGHHISLHFTVVKGKVHFSPSFFGTNPAEVREGPRKGLRVLAREEDLARDFFASLSPEQQKTAIVDAKAYNDILTSADRVAALKGQPNGLATAKLSPKQMDLLKALVEEYADNFPAELAAERKARYAKAAKNLYFAWAGVLERGGPHYYRIAGPDFLIEYDNTQNGANHIHSVWRDYAGDWGQDVLKAHYQYGHATVAAE
ncbi:MAG: DUF3500 domain-containing protein, partial [Bryobacter sp.]|nr:DUF3500 domain-containing protein [Bryobacter sp.]